MTWIWGDPSRSATEGKLLHRHPPRVRIQFSTLIVALGWHRFKKPGLPQGGPGFFLTDGEICHTGSVKSSAMSRNKRILSNREKIGAVRSRTINAAFAASHTLMPCSEHVAVTVGLGGGVGQTRRTLRSKAADFARVKLRAQNSKRLPEGSKVSIVMDNAPRSDLHDCGFGNSTGVLNSAQAMAEFQRGVVLTAGQRRRGASLREGRGGWGNVTRRVTGDFGGTSLGE